MLEVNDRIYSDVSGRTYTITWVSSAISQAEVGFASTEAEGDVFFIKRLMNMKYPLENKTIGAEVLRKKQEFCNNHFRKFSEVYNSVKRGCGESGACVPILDYFRDGPFYYTVYRRINADTLSLEEISSLASEEKYKILLRLVQGLMPLHVLGVIHGDLKPDNILVQKKDDSWRIRLIDMNDCYVAGQPNEPGAVLGTMEYYSPELANYNFYEIEDPEDEEEMALVRRMANSLTVKSDVFALGIIFCEFFSGQRPAITDDSISGIFEAARKNSLELPKGIQKDAKLSALINKMLAPDFRDRPTLTQVGAGLQQIINKKLTPPEILCEPTENDEFQVSIETYGEGYILFTTDGTKPDLSSKRYEKPFKVKKFTTIKAITTDGKKITDVKSIQAWQMMPKSHRPRIIVKGRDVSIIPDDKSPIDTKIYYTTDNTSPSIDSQLYTGKFVAASDVSMVRAIAIEPLSLPSREADCTKVYKLKVTKPIIHYKLGQVTMESSDGNAIYYTLDGSMPTKDSKRYSGEFNLVDTTNFHVIAICVDETGSISDPSEIKRPSGLLKKK